MTPHPTYITLRGESGRGIREVLYAGPSQKEAREAAQRGCGYGEVMPNKDGIRYSYFTRMEVWSEGEKVTESGYTKNGHKVKDQQTIRDEKTDVSNTKGKI